MNGNSSMTSQNKECKSEKVNKASCKQTSYHTPSDLSNVFGARDLISDSNRNRSCI